MATGIEMLMKAAGVDPKAIISDFEKLKAGVLTTLKAIESQTKATLESQAQMMALTQEMLEDLKLLKRWAGRSEQERAEMVARFAHNQKLLEEIIAWTGMKKAKRSEQPAQPPAQ